MAEMAPEPGEMEIAQQAAKKVSQVAKVMGKANLDESEGRAGKPGSSSQFTRQPPGLHPVPLPAAPAFYLDNSAAGFCGRRPLRPASLRGWAGAADGCRLSGR